MFIMIRVSNLIPISFLASSLLANQIKLYLYTLPTNAICGTPLIINNENECNLLYQSGWSSITVNKGLCNSITGILTISNNTCLQYIYIESETLRNINSLILNSLPNLEMFITEGYSLHDTSDIQLSSTF